MTRDSHTARPAPMTPRMAVGTVFFCFGFTLGLWGGSMPEAARAASASADAVGSAFVGYGVASILGMAVVGKVGRGVSLKARLLAVIALAALCLAALFHVRSAAQLIAGLFVFSFVASSVDLVMNSEALAVERDRGRPVLASFHGLASLGVGGGAIAGSYLSVMLGLTATAVVAAAVYAVAAAAVVAGTPDRGATQPAGGGSAWFLPDGALVGLGLVVGSSIAGEVAATMFSAQTLTGQAPALAAYAGLGATAFALVQSAVRMTGDRLRALLGDLMLIRISLAAALAGFLIVVVSTGFAVSALGFAVVGLGTACIVPCGFAMTARMSARPAAAMLSMLAIVSGVIRIPAPLAYGALAGHAGFAPAFVVYALFVAGALAFALVSMGKIPMRRTA